MEEYSNDQSERAPASSKIPLFEWSSFGQVVSVGHVDIGEVTKLDFLGHGQSVISWSNQGTPKKYRKFLH